VRDLDQSPVTDTSAVNDPMAGGHQFDSASGEFTFTAAQGFTGLGEFKAKRRV